ncbi:YjcZ family sporulation protein [Lysinibacillus fusiformis]|nr:YjcZ family sporulation protein [Lysinibacillus fusiformis]
MVNFNNYCGGNDGSGNSSTFVLIVVLFILLNIVGASFIC